MGILFVHELLCYTTFKTYYDKWSCRPLLSSEHVTPRWHIEDGRPTKHSTQHSGYKTGGLHYSSCAHSAFHITISGHQQKVIIHEGREGDAPVQENANCLTVSQCNTSVQYNAMYQATESRHRSCIKPFWAATIYE